MSNNVIKLADIRESKQQERDEHVDMVIDSTIEFIRKSTELSPALTNLEIIRGVWMGLSIELFPQHYRDANPQADALVAEIFGDLCELIDETDAKRAEESTKH